MWAGAIALLKGSKLARYAAMAVLLLLLLGAAILAFESWKKSIYDEGYAKAAAECQMKRDAYFKGVNDAVAEIKVAALEAVARVEKADAQTAQQLDKTLAAALEKWKKNPFVVYNEKEGKCNLTPDFPKTWNELNKTAREGPQP